MKIFIYLFLVFSLLSCASWRAEETIEVSVFPETVVLKSKKPNISISLKRYDFFDNEVLDKEEMNDKQRAEILNHIEKVYSESNLFNIVDIDSPNKDMSVEVNVTRRNSSNTVLTVLTVLTAYLVPRRVIEEVTITTRFLDKKGELVGMVEKTDEVITWHQLFMLFAFPFNIPGTVEDETIQDLNRSSIVEAFTDGYFIEIND